MWLVGKTIDIIKEQGDTANTLYGSYVAMVSNDYDMIVPDEDMKDIKNLKSIS